MNTNGAALGSDKLIVKLANGDQTIVIKEISFTNLFLPPTWESSEIDISSLLPITDQMMVIFEVGDSDPNFIDAVEAGVDFFEVYDANPPSGAIDLFRNGVSIVVSPNPSSTHFNLNYDIKDWKGEASLLIYNALGQIVEMQKLEGSVGRISVGSDLGEGVYFTQIVNNGELGLPIKLLKQR
ncbi:MAG: T9SS type A sorting domain-containing protein [Saprospiraceae bacterium]|nr:T9SS type A sorting domain-containing protein [Saprospiraceae bacterium]